MRVYPAEEERKLFELERSRDWLRSGLISPAQAAAVETGLGPVLTASGWAIRLTAFGFTMVAQTGLIAYVGLTLGYPVQHMGWVLLTIAVGLWAAAETAAKRYRLYRFGVEEALVFGAVQQALTGIFLICSFHDMSFHGLVALTIGVPFFLLSATAYVRFGFPYAPFFALLGLGFTVGGLELGEDTTRAALAVLYLGISAATLFADVPDYERDRWDLLRGGAYLMGYLMLNLALESFVAEHWLRGAREPQGPVFYKVSFACVCMLPVAAVWLGTTLRKRALLDAGIVTALLTLMTWKPYVGLERNVWDPAVFGVFLIGVSLGLRRWLEGGLDGRRGGVTAAPVLKLREQELPAQGLAAAAFASGQADPSASPQQPPGFKGGGGSSGGAGAQGTF